MQHYQRSLHTARFTVHSFIRASALLLAFCATLTFLASCFAGGTPMLRRPSAGQPVDIAAALAELDAMQPPEGVDARVFQHLKDALADALREQAGKVVSAPPRGVKNLINDFAIYSESGQLRLNWRYRNVGDYDQNGIVGVSDITPIAMHWQEDAADVNSIQGVIDGSGSEKVDIADITPIAQNFAVRCEGYVLQNSPSPGGTWNSIQSFEFSTGGGMGRKTFEYVTPEASGKYYRVRAFHGAEVGDPSNVVFYGGPPTPPEITGVTPAEGTTGAQIVFVASTTGTTPITVTWNFGGGATPNTPIGHVVTATLGAVGEYTVNVWASNAAGADNYQFTLNVNDVPLEAPVINSVAPLGGMKNTPVQFTADVTGSPPLVCSWDFGGGAAPNTPDGQVVTVTLYEAGEYTVNVWATNAVGTDNYQFTLTVYDEPPEAPVISSVSPLSGMRNTPVQFTASVTGTPPLAYAWNFGGGATPNTPFEASPFVTLANSSNLYYASLTVTNAAGIDTFDFTLMVTDTPQGAVVVDAIGGDYVSLAIVDGNPAIAYQRKIDPPGNENPSCFFVRAGDANGVFWNPPVQAFSAESAFPGRHNNLVVANGHPAISNTIGFLIEKADVKFARALGKDGKEWNSPVQVWSTMGTDNAPSSLLIVDKRPALAIPENSYGATSLLYYHSEDLNGDRWPETPVVVTSSFTNTYVGSCDMKIVGDGINLPFRPGILLSLDRAETLFFLSSDELGTQWEPGVKIEGVSNSSALALVEGHPALVWRIGGELPRALYYMRSDDEKGQGWSKKVPLDEWIDDCSGQMGFAIISGRPAVAYADGPADGRRLYYTVSEDVRGENWREAIEIPTAGRIRDNVALLEVNGRPAIAFGVADAGGALFFIQANDEFGHDWPV